MKRLFLTTALLLMLTLSTLAQALTTTDAVLVYYMPKTVLAFDVEYTETTRTQGPFYQYAERYLGTKDIVMADETQYELKGVTLHTKTVADKDRAYKFTPSGNQRANIVLDNKGIMKAYNAKVEEGESKSQRVYESTSQQEKTERMNKDRFAERAKSKEQRTKIAPLSEEALFASSKAKMAEAAAKQIYRIRETRINLLSGEVEHMPTDSKMLDRTLEELDEQEAELIALFIGTTKRHKHHKIIYLTPEDDMKDAVLLRFSRFAGPVAADDMSGEPIKLTVSTFKQELLPSEEKKPTPVSQLYYNLPGEATVRVCDNKGHELAGKTFPIAQFGVSIALPQDLVKRKPHILFDTCTGAIKSISE